jgi:hypothetical protein
VRAPAGTSPPLAGEQETPRGRNPPPSPPQELALAAPAARPLRRAAARAVGAWVPRLEAGDRPAAYAALARCLSDAGDAAVRLAAVSALRALVDDFGFDAGHFMGCAGAVLQGLAAMLTESDELDTQTQVGRGRRGRGGAGPQGRPIGSGQRTRRHSAAARGGGGTWSRATAPALPADERHSTRPLLFALPPLPAGAPGSRTPQVFSLLNLVIERLGPDVRPFCDAILQLLPRVWGAAEGQSLLRMQVGPPSAGQRPSCREPGLGQGLCCHKRPALQRSGRARRRGTSHSAEGPPAVATAGVVLPHPTPPPPEWLA